MMVLSQKTYIESSMHTLNFCGNTIPTLDNNERIKCILKTLQNHGYKINSINSINYHDKDFKIVVNAIHNKEYIGYLESSKYFLQEQLHHSYTCPYNDAESFLSNTSFESAYLSALVAYEGAQQHVRANQPIYVLNRPPGHHAGVRWMGGFCYLNNATIAAFRIHQITNEKVGILDIDYHYGNGTADIVKNHNFMAYTSIHRNRLETFPFYSLLDDDCDLRILPIDISGMIDINDYLKHLTLSLIMLKNFGATRFVVSVGYDTANDDPLGGWNFAPDDFKKIGQLIQKVIGNNVVLVQEGGYNLKLMPSCAISLVEGLLRI